ncbi:MAG: MerR family transcriptional regulator [Desulfuromonadaceae bacterium]|nr:MerR family transcriptional regulator [Desulfuromonadaceae bacterium]
MSVEIPDKLYFKIGEVAEITGVKPHVLRYWESEFGSFRPSKSRSRQRLYQRRDIELALSLKELLYHQGFTIAGARKQLRSAGRDTPEKIDLSLGVTHERQLLQDVCADLRRLRRTLDLPPHNDK